MYDAARVERLRLDGQRSTRSKTAVVVSKDLGSGRIMVVAGLRATPIGSVMAVVPMMMVLPGRGGGSQALQKECTAGIAMTEAIGAAGADRRGHETHGDEAAHRQEQRQ